MYIKKVINLSIDEGKLNEVNNELYYKDNYLKEFEAKVVECIEDKEKIMVVLSKTAFYPEGGGQLADVGMLDDIKVIDVQEKDGKIYHIVEKKIEEGRNVKGKIDFEKRFSNMQHHTGEHIVSGIIHQKYNADNIGFHMGKDVVTVDFNVPINREQLKEVEKLANEAIYKNINVQIIMSDKEKLKDVDYRSKKDLDGDIRIVKIPGYDICACCGIHVAKTGEIGIIKILSSEKYKKGTRIYMICGQKAIENYTELYESVDNVSTLLSVKHNEVVEAVKNVKLEIQKANAKNMELQNKLNTEKIKNIEKQKNIIYFEENIPSKEMKNLLNKLKEKAEDVVVLFSIENNICKYMIESEKIDVTSIGKSINEKFNGRGGGKKNFVQGQICGKREEIDTFVKSILE